jgi:hypothetical protein
VKAVRIGEVVLPVHHLPVTVRMTVTERGGGLFQFAIGVEVIGVFTIATVGTTGGSSSTGTGIGFRVFDVLPVAFDVGAAGTTATGGSGSTGAGVGLLLMAFGYGHSAPQAQSVQAGDEVPALIHQRTNGPPQQLPTQLTLRRPRIQQHRQTGALHGGNDMAGHSGGRRKKEHDELSDRWNNNWERTRGNALMTSSCALADGLLHTASR